MTIKDTPIIRKEDVCVTNLDNIPQIPVYRPTEEEFNDFEKFIDLIEARGAHHMGVCKIIPPKNWKARKNGYTNDILSKLVVVNPITQSTTGSDGIFIQDIKSEKSLSFDEYKKYSESKNAPPTNADTDEFERQYWKEIINAKPQYGANVSGTLTDEKQKIWNIACLPTLLDEVLRDQNLILDGINTPYLYFGSWLTTFGWHVEDVDLYSINYLHYGAPKFWYTIPPAFARKFENLTRDLYKSDFLKCDAFLRHKTVVISPNLLKRYGIPTRKIIQKENEFMFTFPYGYHAGFNMGLNIAESTNFASPRWIEYGKQAKFCLCWADTVKINMEPFIRLYQSEQYDGWKKGNENIPHPLKEYEQKFCELKNGGPINLSSSLIGLRKRTIKSDDEPIGKKISKKSLESDDSNKNNKNVFFNIFDTPNMKKSSRVQRAHPLKSLNIKEEKSETKETEKSPVKQEEKVIDVKPKELIDYSNSQMETNGVGKYIPRLLKTNFEALWRANPFDFEVEKNFNDLIGNFYPHCAVCSIIWPITKASEILLKAKSSYDSSHIPKSTEPHISQLAFSKERQFVICNQLKSLILRCSKCNLTVHARCYGKTELEKSIRRKSAADNKDEEWLCDRCLKFSSNIYCCLCPIRGGALKRMSNSNGQNKWAHVICTLLTQDMQFDDIVRRRPRYPSKQSTSLNNINDANNIESDTKNSSMDTTDSNTDTKNSSADTKNNSDDKNSNVDIKSNSDTKISKTDVKNNLDTKISKTDVKNNSDTKISKTDVKNNSDTKNSKTDVKNNSDTKNSKTDVKNNSDTKNSKTDVKNNKKDNINNNVDIKIDSNNSNNTKNKNSNKNTKKKKVINTSNDGDDNSVDDNNYQKCHVCHGRQYDTPLCKCSYEGCQSRVHVTCAFFHSLLIESETYPDLLYLICDKHPHYYTKEILNPNIIQHSSSSYISVNVGDYVYAQCPTDGYFYLATIQWKESDAFCKLIFPTGEYSDDTEIKYVKSHNIAREGPPSIGTIVTVLWTDDELCDVKFQGLVPEVWTVKFKHTGHNYEISRDLFYKTTEPIPPHVERFLVEKEVATKTSGTPSISSSTTSKKQNSTKVLKQDEKQIVKQEN